MTNGPTVGVGGVPFGRVWNAAGATGFYGEGYAFHRLLGPLGPDFRGATFVAKTATCDPRDGNMRLVGWRPYERFPACIKVNFRKAAVLNAVGLSNPGLHALLQQAGWEDRAEPFLISYAAVEPDPDERVKNAALAAGWLAARRRRFKAAFGIEVNVSCPNAERPTDGHAGDASDILAELNRRLPGVPLLPKVNALVSVDFARHLAGRPGVAGVVCSNSIPWGSVPEWFDWAGLFGKVSPLAHLGGGGLSGAPLTEVVRQWVGRAAELGFPVPVVACGGVTSARDAHALFDAGAAAVQLGSVAIVRPWRVAGIIKSIARRFA